MNIIETGYINCFEKKCTFIQDNMTFYVIPLDEPGHFPFEDYYQKKGFFIDYSSHVKPISSIYVNKIDPVISSPGLKIEANFIAKRIADCPISKLRLVGDEIDEFFNPVKHYYRKKQNDTYTSTDLLYSSDTAYSYSFSYKDTPISLDVQYGNAFSKGIMGDMKFHATLSLSFEPTCDLLFLYELSSIVKTFIQFVRRIRDYNFRPTELLGFTESHKPIQHIGILFDHIYDPNKIMTLAFRVDNYSYEPGISFLLQMIANEPDFPLAHLPDSNTSLFDYSSPERFAAIFAGFEYECSKDDIYSNTKEMSDCDDIRKKAISSLKSLSLKSNSEKHFIDMAEKRLKQLGTQFGQKQKIINAFNVLDKYLKNSSKYLLPSDSNISDIAKELTSLRGSIIHGNMGRQFTESEQSYIKVLDVMQFTMTLRRSKMPIHNVDIILGQLYYLNTVHFE